jgi:hypothetical protein
LLAFHFYLQTWLDNHDRQGSKTIVRRFSR